MRNMSYGYRLNIEDIYLKSADEHWAIAKSEMVSVNDEGPVSAKATTFNAPISEKGVSSAVQAVVGWAISLEAFVNLAWNLSISPKIPSDYLNKKLIKQLSTIEKLKEILKQNQVKLDGMGWLSALKELFELRNKLVHYKTTVEYLGFSFAPGFARDFEENRLSNYRAALTSAVQEIGKVVDVRTDFISGKYEVIYYDA